jgi:hypothetical protein
VATVQLNPEAYSGLKTHHLKQKNGFGIWKKTITILLSLFYRLWWHTKAYGTVFGMMVLVVASMIYLYLHSLIAKFLKFQVKEVEKSV